MSTIGRNKLTLEKINYINTPNNPEKVARIEALIAELIIHKIKQDREQGRV